MASNLFVSYFVSTPVSSGYGNAVLENTNLPTNMDDLVDITTRVKTITENEYRRMNPFDIISSIVIINMTILHDN